MSISYSNIRKLLPPIAGLQVLIVIGLTILALWHGTYHVAEEDETIYYNTTRSFAQTGSVRAVDCNTEDVSKIGQANWYGPMYSIFYGGIAKIIGLHTYNFLFINLLCFAGILLLVWRSVSDKEARYMLLASILALYPFISYLFTYFPETLELLFAVILSFKLHKIFTEDASGKRIIQFVLLVMFFALFRITSIFWVFGLLALSTSFKSFAKYTGVGVLCFLLINIYAHYFIAPAYGNSMAYLSTHSINLSSLLYFIKRATTNIYVFFTRNPFYDLLQVLVLFIAAYSWFVSKSRFMLATLIIAFTYYTILMVLYTPYSYFFNKQVACLYPLLLIALFITDTTKLKYLAAFTFLLFSPLTYVKAARYIIAHKNSAIEYNENIINRKQLDTIASKTMLGHPITIMVLYRDFDSVMTYPVFTTSVPVITADKQPILYSCNFPLDNKFNPNSKSEPNFILYHKLHIDYILSRHPLQIDSTALTYSCNLFYLYRNNRIAK